MGLAAGYCRRPRLFTIHGVKRHEASKRAGRERLAATLDAWIEPHVHARFDHMVCISSYAEQVAGKGKVTYRIPNAVRSVFFDVRRESSSQRPLVLFVGQLSPLKGADFLLRAHAELRSVYPDLETVLCGEPETAGYMGWLQSQAGGGVTFKGRTNADQLRGWLSRANVLVLPSRQENAPMVIAEAMATGTPVVATRVGGVPDMIEDRRTGLLVNPGDVPGLVNALKRLLGDADAAGRLAAGARQHAMTYYHPAVVGEQTVAVYRQLLATGNSQKGRA